MESREKGKIRSPLNAIVAEQSISFNAGELNIGIGGNSKSLNIDISNLKPVLSLMGVLEKGELSIHTKDDLENIIKKYPRELFHYSLDKEKDLYEMVKRNKDWYVNS